MNALRFWLALRRINRGGVSMTEEVRKVAEPFANWWCNRAPGQFLHTADPALYRRLHALSTADQDVVFGHAARVYAIAQQLREAPIANSN